MTLLFDPNAIFHKYHLQMTEDELDELVLTNNQVWRNEIEIGSFLDVFFVDNDFPYRNIGGWFQA